MLFHYLIVRISNFIRILRNPKLWPWALKVQLTKALYASNEKAKYEAKQLTTIKNLNEAAFTYGETPLAVLDQIATDLGKGPGTRVLDLGCGMGIALSYWAAKYQWKSIGIEQIPSLANIAKKIRHYYAFQIIEADFLLVDWPESDIIYIAATCYEKNTLSAIAKKINALKNNPTVACMSATLPNCRLSTTRSIPVRFDWGLTRMTYYHDQNKPIA
ncbi:class I SAM-dependent methyltransferase [bacterium]|nr:class I SAM-dependent methyltransferase [bacterium]